MLPALSLENLTDTMIEWNCHKTGALLTTGLLAGATACHEQPKMPDRPNIVYIMTDDHTAQMMSCYDTRYMQTPNLDRIARDGVRFTNSFVANSLSGPSRACMITGKHSCANRFFDNTTCVFDGSQQTFPKLLQRAGYQTALVGKWHLESLPTGFDFWEILPGQGDYYNPDFVTQRNDTVRREGYVTNIITDDAIRWMDQERDPSTPFCLLIHHKARSTATGWPTRATWRCTRTARSRFPKTSSTIMRVVRRPPRRRCRSCATWT